MSASTASARDKARTPKFLLSAENELRRVEEVLSWELASNVETVRAASSHILEAGGKRLRPTLVVLSAKSWPAEYDVDRLVNIAAVTELIHMATLMHDDVIDGAERRRGRMTANTFWGNQISVLTGDYMLAKAFSILACDADAKIMQALSRATVAMTEGEISQIESRGDTRSLTAYYLSTIRDKTAAFMSACCRVGAILASAMTDAENSLAGYGLNLGLAFQITDDLLDLVGDPGQTGKPVGGDIREGKATMPVILALERSSSVEKTKIERILAGHDVTSGDVEFVRKTAEETGAIEATRETAAGYVKRAIEDVRGIPPSPARQALEDLAEYILQRRH